MLLVSVEPRFMLLVSVEPRFMLLVSVEPRFMLPEVPEPLCIGGCVAGVVGEAFGLSVAVGLVGVPVCA